MTAAGRLTGVEEEADLRARLERTWASPKGLWGR
jgi:hypothetical protein